MRSQLERLDTDTLFGLLQMYEPALEELNATGERHEAASSPGALEALDELDDRDASS
jgi:hypothetical protein